MEGSLLLYTLWNNLLGVPMEIIEQIDPSDESSLDSLASSQRRELSSLGSWSILPVLSLDRTLLITPANIAYVLWMDPTRSSPSDERNRELEERMREAGEAERIRTEERSKIEKQVAADADDSQATTPDWSWTTMPYRRELGAMSGTPSQSENTMTTPSSPPAPPHGESSSGNVAAHQESLRISETIVSQLRRVEDEEVEEQRDVLIRLGVPVFDPTYFRHPPCPYSSKIHKDQKLLVLLMHWHLNGAIFSGNAAPVDLMNPQSQVLDFTRLSENERCMLLLSLFRSPAMSATQAKRSLRQLPLFTLCGGGVTALEAGRPVYWCPTDADADRENEFLVDLDFSVVPGGSNTAPILLRANQQLVADVFPALDITELTFLERIRRFAVPALSSDHTPYSHKYELFSRLKLRWTSCRENREIVESLRGISFIPAWLSSPLHVDGAAEYKEQRSNRLYTPREMFSWKNEELVRVIRCTETTRGLCPYFPPPDFRCF